MIWVNLGAVSRRLHHCPSKISRRKTGRLSGNTCRLSASLLIQSPQSQSRSLLSPSSPLMDVTSWLTSRVPLYLPLLSRIAKYRMWMNLCLHLYPEFSTVPVAGLELLKDLLNNMHALGRMAVLDTPADDAGTPRKDPVFCLRVVCDLVVFVHE